MHTQPNLRDIDEGEAIEGFYAVRDASLQTTSTGKPYIRMTLSDASGTVLANAWDAGKDVFDGFTAGDVIKIRATGESYRGKMQLKVAQLRLAHASEYDPGAFLPVTEADIGALRDELRRLVESISDADYQRLLETFFGDDELVERFAFAPAAKANHHAYVGGLLEHTISIAHLCDMFCQTSTTPLNRDLLLAGALLHDIGKIDELQAKTAIEYSDRGMLLGHLMIGTLMVEARVAQLADFPEEKCWLVQHMILSHHGRHEYGSPVLPAIPEAFALHHIDNLDAKTVAARRTIDEDAENDRSWTDRSWMLETRLFKGSMASSAEAMPEESSPAGNSGLLFD